MFWFQNMTIPVFGQGAYTKMAVTVGNNNVALYWLADFLKFNILVNSTVLSQIMLRFDKFTHLRAQEATVN